MASVQRRTRTTRKGSKYVCYRVRYRGPDGRERSKSFAQRRDAVKFASSVETDLMRGQWTDPALARIPFGTWASDWLAAKRPSLKPKTYASYESLLRVQIAPYFSARPIGAVTPMEVRTWIASLHEGGLGAQRIRHAHTLLKQIFTAAMDADLIAKSPCRGAELPAVPRAEMRALSLDEIHALASAIDKRYEAFVYLAAFGGLRFGEMAALRRKRVDLAAGRVTVTESLSDVAGVQSFTTPKNGRSRAVAIPPSLRLVLAEHLSEYVDAADDALVFTSPSGGPLRHSNFTRRFWLPALKDAKLGKLRIHDLRHTCASLLILGGTHMRVVAEHLGHSTTAVTERYAHLHPAHEEALTSTLEDLFQGTSAAHERPHATGLRAVPERV